MGKHKLFEKCNLYPEKLPKAERFCTIFGTFSTGFETYSNMSSAYKETLCSIPILSMPFMDCRDLSIIESGYFANAKRRGFKGHPCLVPLSIGKNCERTLFVITETLGVE